jgi:hypothetical protein
MRPSYELCWGRAVPAAGQHCAVRAG